VPKFKKTQAFYVRRAFSGSPSPALPGEGLGGRCLKRETLTPGPLSRKRPERETSTDCTQLCGG